MLFFMLGTILILTGCQSTWRQPFPDAEIVYQMEYNVKNENVWIYEMGFVNADGTNPVIIKTGSLFHRIPLGHYIKKPVWGDSGNSIYFLTEGQHDIFQGYSSYWGQNYKPKICKNWYIPAQIEAVGDGIALISPPEGKVILVDLKRCKETRLLLDHSDTSDPLVAWSIGVSYSPENNTLLFGKKDLSSGNYQLMSLNKTTGKTMVLTEGLNPSWSPDAAQIAFIRSDGIFVMNVNSGQIRQILSGSFFGNYMYVDAAPMPRWSPDGEWLVYHRCSNGKNVCSIAESSIYKVEVATGKEVKIVDGGIFPDWKK